MNKYGKRNGYWYLLVYNIRDAKTKLIHKLIPSMEEHLKTKFSEEGVVVAMNVMGGYHVDNLTNFDKITERECFPSSFGTNDIGGMNISEELHDRLASEDRGLIPLSDNLIKFEEWVDVRQGDVVTLCREDEEPIKIKLVYFAMSFIAPHQWIYEKVG